MSAELHLEALRPTLNVAQAQTGGHVIRVTGAWNLRFLESALPALRQRLTELPADAAWDLTGMEMLDHAGAMLMWRAWGQRMPAEVAIRDEHRRLFAHLEVNRARPETVRPPLWLVPFLVVGNRMLRFREHAVELSWLLGRVVIDTFRLIAHPDRIPWREISANLYRTGAQALGITALVGFLVGVVLSYLSAQQLKAFGADIYIINLLGVSIIRELGPVLAAILIAGRSGSAMTAQLGVMRVTEELDALAVMGIPHTIRLILPKIIALGIAMPLIILWTDAVALAGGMISARIELGLEYQFFLSSLPGAVPISNLWLGLSKGVVFGMLIALIACHYGLRIKPNTESLGTGTTNSVVTAITIVIVVDAIFAIMFSDVGSF